jgi:anti-sigma factor RsiW
MTDDELLATYADGIAELDADDRTRVDELLARDPAARAELEATRTMLRRLRDLPRPEAPDLAAAIASAVGPDVPRPWWRNWRWLVPIGALAATAAAALLWLRQPAPETPAAQLHLDAGAAPHVAEQDSPAADAIWLAGQIIDLTDPTEIDARLDELDRDVRELIDADDVTGGILPASDLRWIDNLDDSALDRAERFLDKKRT